MNEDYYVDDIYSDNPRCPVCNEIGAYMGALGSLDWFRCPACGAEFSTSETEVES